jgi:hypothetical protein
MNEILEIIYKHLCNEENDRLITIEKTEPISISSIEYEEFRKDIKDRLKVKLKTGVYNRK